MFRLLLLLIVPLPHQRQEHYQAHYNIIMVLLYYTVQSVKAKNNVHVILLRAVPSSQGARLGQKAEDAESRHQSVPRASEEKFAAAGRAALHMSVLLFNTVESRFRLYNFQVFGMVKNHVFGKYA